MNIFKTHSFKKANIYVKKQENIILNTRTYYKMTLPVQVDPIMALVTDRHPHMVTQPVLQDLEAVFRICIQEGS